MYLYLDIYKQFQCIGTECRNSCCATGWQIPLVDRVTEYYENLEGEFGDFLRRNIVKSEGKKTFVKLTPEHKCPFLNEKGLCRIYIECGEQWMSDVCRLFPRARYDKNGNAIRGLSVSCEEVLRLLYSKPEAIHLCAEATTEAGAVEERSFFELVTFIRWGMELLQDETIPFGAALATVVYTSMEAQPFFAKRDFENFGKVLRQASGVQEQFIQTERELSSDIGETAWQLLFGVTDTFCQILNEAEALERENYLWGHEVFDKKDEDRCRFLKGCHKQRKPDRRHRTFMRRLAACYFLICSMKCEEEPADALYLTDFCNYLIVEELLPLTWKDAPEYGGAVCFSRMSRISSFFEESGIIRQFVGPVIQDLFHPDVFSYAVAFMALFDDLSE